MSFQNKVVTCALIDGLAIFEGDIVLGTVEELELTRTASIKVEK